MVTSLILLLETLDQSSNLSSIIHEAGASCDLLLAIKEACGSEEVKEMGRMIEGVIDKETRKGESESERFHSNRYR